MLKVRKKKEAGFTLIEMLIVVLLVSILAAAGAFGYFGYVKSARVAEGVALAGAALTAATTCAQSNPTAEGTQCTEAKLFPRIGLGSDGLSPDARWDVSITTVDLDPAATPPKYTAGAIKVVGQEGKDTEGLSAGIFLKDDAWVSRCKLDGTGVTVDSPTC